MKKSALGGLEKHIYDTQVDLSLLNKVQLALTQRFSHFLFNLPNDNDKNKDTKERIRQIAQSYRTAINNYHSILTYANPMHINIERFVKTTNRSNKLENIYIFVGGFSGVSEEPLSSSKMFNPLKTQLKKIHKNPGTSLMLHHHYNPLWPVEQSADFFYQHSLKRIMDHLGKTEIQVSIVAYSLGGIIASYALQATQDERTQNLDFLQIGAPVRGLPLTENLHRFSSFPGMQIFRELQPVSDIINYINQQPIEQKVKRLCIIGSSADKICPPEQLYKTKEDYTVHLLKDIEHHKYLMNRKSLRYMAEWLTTKPISTMLHEQTKSQLKKQIQSSTIESRTIELPVFHDPLMPAQ